MRGSSSSDVVSEWVAMRVLWNGGSRWGFRAEIVGRGGWHMRFVVYWAGLVWLGMSMACATSVSNASAERASAERASVGRPLSTVSLRVKGAPSDALVHIDEEFVGYFGYVERRGVALPPGRHRITVERSGYFPWDRLVEVVVGDSMVRLDVELARVPD